MRSISHVKNAMRSISHVKNASHIRSASHVKNASILLIIKWNLMKKQKDCRTALRLTKEEKDKLYLIDSNLSKAVRKCIQAYEIDYEVLRGAINRTE